MANKTIFELPEQTGITADDVFAVVNSANTTTSKIKFGTLDSNLGVFTKTGTTIYDKITTKTQTIGNITYYDGNIFAGGNNNTTIQNTTRSFEYNVFLGGYSNTMSNNAGSGEIEGASLIGGHNNSLGRESRGSTMIGGNNNTLDYGRYQGIIGSQSITTNQSYVVSIGATNGYIYNQQSTLIGTNNSNIRGERNFIGGGASNTITNNTSNDNGILAGTNNSIDSGADACIIIGGQYGQITGSTSNYNLIGGGQSNRVYASTHSASVCGASNEVIGTSNFSGIFVGQTNTISGATHAGIVGGTNHSNKGNRSVIVGGSGNTITHERSVILGGSGLTSNENDEVLVQNLKISGQTSGNFHDNGSGSTQTIDWNEGNLQRINLTANTSITLTNLKPGGTYMLYMNNGGAHSISSVSATGYTFKYETNGLPAITHNSTDLFVFDVFGTDTCYVRYHADFG